MTDFLTSKNNYQWWCLFIGATIATLVSAAPSLSQTSGFTLFSEDLIELNLTTGTHTTVGPVGTFGFRGLTMSADGVLWGVSLATEDLWRIDPADATSTRVGELDASFSGNDIGMTFDACGTLWLVSDGMLYEVDPDTASTNLYASFSEDVSGLTATGSELIALVTSPTPSLARIHPMAGTLETYGAELELWDERAGLDFDSSGALWAVFYFEIPLPSFPPPTIQRLDPVTGEVLSTLELPFGSDVIEGSLTAAPPIGVCGTPPQDIPLDDRGALALFVLLVALAGVLLLPRM